LDRLTTKAKSNSSTIHKEAKFKKPLTGKDLIQDEAEELGQQDDSDDGDDDEFDFDEDLPDKDNLVDEASVASNESGLSIEESITRTSITTVKDQMSFLVHNMRNDEHFVELMDALLSESTNMLDAANMSIPQWNHASVQNKLQQEGFTVVEVLTSSHEDEPAKSGEVIEPQSMDKLSVIEGEVTPKDCATPTSDARSRKRKKHT
jgi:hypothetical protein